MWKWFCINLSPNVYEHCGTWNAGDIANLISDFHRSCRNRHNMSSWLWYLWSIWDHGRGWNSGWYFPCLILILTEYLWALWYRYVTRCGSVLTDGHVFVSVEVISTLWEENSATAYCDTHQLLYCSDWHVAEDDRLLLYSPVNCERCSDWHCCEKIIMHLTDYCDTHRVFVSIVVIVKLWEDNSVLNRFLWYSPSFCERCSDWQVVRR
jgi:hypothetical protein